MTAHEQSPSDPRVVQVLEEVYERRDRGESPTLEEYVRRHPDLAADLRRAFDLERLIPEGGALGPGTMLGPYRILDRLGRGGMGSVFRAVDEGLGRHVALKVVADDPLRPSRTLARFAREAQAIGRLRHPSIVTVHAFGPSGPFHWIAMDLIRGSTLSARIATAREQGAPLAIADVAGWALSVARALAHAHAEGIVHRDVKPGNVLLDAEGRAFLSDFGLAIVEGEPALTESDATIGTVFYTAPELIRDGARDADVRSDVFSLGVTLYEALTLHRPFAGRTRHETLSAILRGDPTPPRRLRPELPRDLETVVRTALDGDPDRRYQTSAALAGDLERFLEFRPVLARRPPVARRAALWVRRNRTLAASLAVLLALTAAGLGVLARDAGRRDRERRERAEAVGRWTRSADAAWDAGDLRLASSHYEKVLSLDPDDRRARERSDRARGAAALDRAFLSLFFTPGREELHLVDRAGARSSLEEARRLLGPTGPVSQLQALLELREGSLDGAGRFLDEALERGASRGLLRLRAHVHRRQGRADRAAADEAAVGATPLEGPEEALTEAVALLFLDRDAEAGERLRDVLRDRPGSFHALALQLLVHSRRAETEGTLATLTHLIDRAGGFYLFHELRFESYMTLGRFDLAAGEVERLAGLAPGSASYWGPKIQLLRKTGRLPEARAAAAEALQRLPDAPEVLLEATETFLALRDADRAQELAETMLRKLPESVPVLVAAGRVRYLRKEHAEGARLFRKVLEKRGDDPWYRTWYAACLAGQEDRAGARRELDAVLSRHPRHREALVIRGKLRALEDPAGAARDLAAALEIDPGDERTRAALEALRAPR